MMLGIGGGTGAGFAATSANASSGNANRALFKDTLPKDLRSAPALHPLSSA
jgi:hypothetical protein